jgi:hypothetical protein
VVCKRPSAPPLEAFWGECSPTKLETEEKKKNDKKKMPLEAFSGECSPTKWCYGRALASKVSYQPRPEPIHNMYIYTLCMYMCATIDIGTLYMYVNTCLHIYVCI